MRNTNKIEQTYNFILNYMEIYGYSPSYREISSELGIKSIATVKDYLIELEKAGLIDLGGGKSRAIIVKKRSDKATESVALVGRVAAGVPITAIENVEEEIQLPNSVFGNLSNTFMLKVIGHSMRDIGILDNDFVIVKKQETANNGDVIVAMLNDEVTVKTYKSHSDYVELIPHNRDFSTIIVRNEPFVILGKVIGLMRKGV